MSRRCPENEFVPLLSARLVFN